MKHLTLLVFLFVSLLVATIPFDVKAQEPLGTCSCTAGDDSFSWTKTQAECTALNNLDGADYTCNWEPAGNGTTPGGDPGEGTSPGAGTSGDPIVLKNPLGSSDEASDIRFIIGNIIRVVLGIVGSLSLLIFVYGGLIWTTSAGNTERIKQGRDTLLWAAIGLIIILMSYILVGFIFESIVITVP